MIDRSRIKIIEFDGEDSAGKPKAKPHKPGGKGVRVVEFDDEPKPAPVKSAMPSPGSMKIVEFGMDDDGPSAPKSPKIDRSEMKIVGYDNEPSTASEKPAGKPAGVKGMKIVEFD